MFHSLMNLRNELPNSPRTYATHVKMLLEQNQMQPMKFLGQRIVFLNSRGLKLPTVQTEQLRYNRHLQVPLNFQNFGD